LGRRIVVSHPEPRADVRTCAPCGMLALALVLAKVTWRVGAVATHDALTAPA
jgi:hypothetical protein